MVKEKKAEEAKGVSKEATREEKMVEILEILSSRVLSLESDVAKIKKQFGIK